MFGFSDFGDSVFVGYCVLFSFSFYTLTIVTLLLFISF